MTDEVEQAPYDPSRVMLNGAAIALVTNLTNGMEARITAEIKAVESRQTKQLADAVSALTGDVDSLEEWRDQIEDAQQFRAGQMSFAHAAGRFLLRYERVILGIGLGIIGLAAAAFGLHVQVGP